MSRTIVWWNTTIVMDLHSVCYQLQLCNSRHVLITITVYVSITIKIIIENISRENSSSSETKTIEKEMPFEIISQAFDWNRWLELLKLWNFRRIFKIACVLLANFFRSKETTFDWKIEFYSVTETSLNVGEFFSNFWKVWNFARRTCEIELDLISFWQKSIYYTKLRDNSGKNLTIRA